MKRNIIHMLVDSIDGAKSEDIDLDELPLEQVFGMVQIMPGLSSYYDERLAKGLVEKGDPKQMTGETAYPITDSFLTSADGDLDHAARNVSQLSKEIPHRVKLKRIPVDTMRMIGLSHVDPTELNDDDLCIEIIAQILASRDFHTWREVKPPERLAELQHEFSLRQQGLSSNIPGLVFDTKTIDLLELEKRANRALELAKIYNFNSEKGWSLVEFITSTWPDDLLAELAVLAFRTGSFSNIHDPKILAQMMLDRAKNRRSN